MSSHSTETLSQRLKSEFYHTPDEACFAAKRFHSFCGLFVLIVMLDWGLAQILRAPTMENSKTQIAFLTLILGIGFFLRKQSRHLCLIGLFVSGLLLGSFEFPNTPNHRLIEVVVLGLACLSNVENSQERRLFFSFIRAFALLVFFYAGVQKILLGTYFTGQYLAYKTYSAISFQNLGFLWCSQEELETFKSLSWPPSAGMGPFQLNTWYGLILSNATWVLELVLPVVCFFGKRKNIWAAITLVFVLGIQAMALEIEFLLIMMCLLSLYFKHIRDRQLFFLSCLLVVLHGFS